MIKTIYSVVAAAAILALVTHAHAGQQLTDAQLDNVTAGATAIGTGLGAAGGSLASGVSVTIDTSVHGHSAFAIGDVTSIAASAHRGPGAFASSTLSLGVVSP